MAEVPSNNHSFEVSFKGDSTHTKFIAGSTPTVFIGDVSTETKFVGDQSKQRSMMISGILLGCMALNEFLIEGNNLMAAEAETASMLAQWTSMYSDMEIEELKKDNDAIQKTDPKNTGKINQLTTQYQLDQQKWQSMLSQSQANSDLMNGTVQNGPTSQKTEIDQFQSLITVWQVSQQAIA